MEHVELLTVQEVAGVLRLHPLSVRRRIAAGDLGAIRLGYTTRAPVRVTSDELARYIGEAAVLTQRRVRAEAA